MRSACYDLIYKYAALSALQHTFPRTPLSLCLCFLMSRSPEALNTEAADTNVSVSLLEMLAFTCLVFIFTQLMRKGAYSSLNTRLTSDQDVSDEQIVSQSQTYAHCCQMLTTAFLSSLTGKRNHYEGPSIQYVHFLAAQKNNEGPVSNCEPSKVSLVVERQTTPYAHGWTLLFLVTEFRGKHFVSHRRCIPKHAAKGNAYDARGGEEDKRYVRLY